MSGDTHDDTKEHRAAFVRWQGIAITQLGYVINLFLGLSVAALGFTFALVKDKDFSPGCWGKIFLVLSAVHKSTSRREEIFRVNAIFQKLQQGRFLFYLFLNVALAESSALHWLSMTAQLASAPGHAAIIDLF